MKRCDPSFMNFMNVTPFLCPLFYPSGNEVERNTRYGRLEDAALACERANALAILGQSTAALAYYDRALKLDPHHAQA